MILSPNSIFSFWITKGKEYPQSEDKIVKFCDYSVYISPKTIYEYKVEDEHACMIIGLATCVSRNENAMDWIWKNLESLESVINAEKHLGGKYVLFFRIKDQYYVMGDATGSIPVFYACDGDNVICASIAYQVADALHLSADKTLLKIRQHSDASKTMPYDYTIWKEIKRLLPNHYLDVNTQRVVRFINQKSDEVAISAEKAIESTLPSMQRLADYYKRRFPVACALTSGRDSRVVLSVFGCNRDIPIYTMKHNEFSEKTPDIVIPKQISEKLHLDYHQVKDIHLTATDIAEADTILGVGNYSYRTLMLAHTINHYFGEYAVINGDVIGQVGKCSLHRDIPERFAIPSYFLCKLHNYSKKAKFALEKWLKEIQDAGEHVNKFDLFSIENRLGVWAANENEIYNLTGQYYLNIFNSRSIIYEWTRVSRKERKNSSIHLAIIRALNPVLLEIPFEASGLLEKISKYNGYTYLCASYLKHYIEKIKSRL